MLPLTNLLKATLCCLRRLRQRARIWYLGETGITISYGNEKVTIKSSKDYEEAKEFFNSLKGKVNPEDFIKATNDLIPVFIKSLNETFREYTVSTDLLTFISSDKISGTITVWKDGVDLGDGLTLDSKVSAYTL